jgi:hypothetical protein
MPPTDRYAPISPEDVTTATAEARLRVAARRAARRQHVGVTFGPQAQVVVNELGTFVEGSLFYKIEGL